MQQERDQRDRGAVTDDVARAPTDAAPRESPERECECERHADRGERVRRLGVEVVLIDHAWPDDRHAESE